MPDADLAPAAKALTSRSFDRRTLLLAAAATAATAGLSGPAHASITTRSGPRFDPHLARRLQHVLREVLDDPSIHSPGAILHVHSPKLGRWTGVAGLGRVKPKEPMRPGDRFRAGSIMKPFLSVVVLQLAERGRLSLEARLPDLLPADVVGRFPTAPDITVRMLLDHRSGIPEWDLPAQDDYAARHPAKIWRIGEIIDLAAAQAPRFAPGTAFFYSNTDYNLLGLIVERITGHSWRHEITGRVVHPLGLRHTSLPAPGHRSIEGPHAHGYFPLDGKLVDLTQLDPSMAGAAGGGGLVTTVNDLSRFWDALLKGRLFRHRATLKHMLAFRPTPRRGHRRLRAGSRAVRAARRRGAHRPPRRRRDLPHVRGPAAAPGRDDGVRAQLPGRPHAAHLPGGEGARQHGRVSPGRPHGARSA